MERSRPARGRAKKGGAWNGLAAQESVGVKSCAYGGKKQAHSETITQTPDLGARRGVWIGLAAREGVKKRAYGRKKQAYTETITQTPALGARRGVWNGLAAQGGVNERAYGGIEQAYPETITQTPDLGARRGVWNRLAARERREKGSLEQVSGTRGC